MKAIINRFAGIMVGLAMAIGIFATGITPTFAATTEVPVTSVSFPTSITMTVGESKTYEITTNPANTTYKTNIEWGSQSNGHFAVKTNGCGTYWGKPSSETLTATSKGTGYLNNTVKVYDSKGNYITSYKLSTTVTVKDSSSASTNTSTNTASNNSANNSSSSSASKSIALQSIALNKTSASLQVGNSVTLSVSYTPSNTTDSKTVSWSTSNSAVATVSNGKVVGKKAGTATITAKVGSKTATCKVTVTAKPAASKDGYVSVGNAYTELNKFRTSKSVWQWNSNNKSKTYFNTKKGNTLKALKKDASLENTAKIRAMEIATKFSHTRPNGKSCFTAYPSKYKYRGENIAYGYTTAASVTNAWKETDCKYSGQGHRRNMLNKNFTAVGIACYRKGNTLYWVQCFGK